MWPIFFVCITYLVVSIKQFNSLYALWNMVLGKVTAHVVGVVQ